MNTCPKCQREDHQVKNGLNRSGSQRRKCKLCGARYTPEPKEHGYGHAMRQQAIRLYIDGMNFRRIGRQMGIDHKTVINWVKAYSAQLADAPLPADVNNAELDELFTFVGKKKTSSMS
jgi:transposase-like protein